MALTGPRIIASIYKVTGPDAQGFAGVSGNISIIPGTGTMIKDLVPALVEGGITYNSVITVQAEGLKVHATKYYSPQTAAAIISASV